MFSEIQNEAQDGAKNFEKENTEGAEAATSCPALKKEKEKPVVTRISSSDSAVTATVAKSGTKRRRASPIEEVEDTIVVSVPRKGSDMVGNQSPCCACTCNKDKAGSPTATQLLLEKSIKITAKQEKKEKKKKNAEAEIKKEENMKEKLRIDDKEESSTDSFIIKKNGVAATRRSWSSMTGPVGSKPTYKMGIPHWLPTKYSGLATRGLKPRRPTTRGGNHEYVEYIPEEKRAPRRIDLKNLPAGRWTSVWNSKKDQTRMKESVLRASKGKKAGGDRFFIRKNSFQAAPAVGKETAPNKRTERSGKKPAQRGTLKPVIKSGPSQKKGENKKKTYRKQGLDKRIATRIAAKCSGDVRAPTRLRAFEVITRGSLSNIAEVKFLLSYFAKIRKSEIGPIRASSKGFTCLVTKAGFESYQKAGSLPDGASFVPWSWEKVKEEGFKSFRFTKGCKFFRKGLKNAVLSLAKGLKQGDLGTVSYTLGFTLEGCTGSASASLV